jgi:hypothetical protein
MLNEIKDGNGDLHILYYNSDDYVKLNNHKDIVKIDDTYLYFGDIVNNKFKSYKEGNNWFAHK